MRASIVALALLGAVLGPPGAGAQQTATCQIADASGTPLNVRIGPQGRIIGRLRNGTVVRIAATARDHKDQAWVQVIENERGRTIGWVLRAHVRCN